MTIDLRSDTVTKPTPGMMEAMRNAVVGDDVFGEDPSVNELEGMVAGLFGKEAALYCASGTMANQIAIRAHTQPGDEVICDKLAHVYIYEGGGIASNSGCQVRTVEGDRGRITATQVRESINPDDVHEARTSLVCLENTSNRGGGSCYELAGIREIRTVCLEHSLSLHLDGARLFNAMVARNETAQQYGELFDTVSVCLNKGLGCPCGSVLTGSSAFIGKARRLRKSFGGGMRQAGYMAATGVYALRHHIDRLKEDHDHARIMGEALLTSSVIESVFPVATNIVLATVRAPFTADSVVQLFRSRNILTTAMSLMQIRLVTHLDVTREMVLQTAEIIRDLEKR